MTTPPRPRVIVVDDDPLILRLVALCLEGQPIDLVTCDGVATALAAMRERAPQVVITDLMMPGQGGLDLLRQMREEPTLAPGATVAVFSAGMQPADRDALAALGVSRLFEKPVAAQALSDFVSQALGGGAPPAADAPAVVALRNFGGDAEMMREFLEDCLEQFPRDLEAGAAALHAGDLRSLRRVAHDLKSILRLLGEGRGSECAAAVERAAAQGDGSDAGALWHDLRTAVEMLLSRRMAG